MEAEDKPYICRSLEDLSSKLKGIISIYENTGNITRRDEVIYDRVWDLRGDVGEVYHKLGCHKN